MDLGKTELDKMEQNRAAAVAFEGDGIRINVKQALCVDMPALIQKCREFDNTDNYWKCSHGHLNERGITYCWKCAMGYD